MAGSDAETGTVSGEEGTFAGPKVVFSQSSETTMNPARLDALVFAWATEPGKRRCSAVT